MYVHHIFIKWPGASFINFKWEEKVAKMMKGKKNN